MGDPGAGPDAAGAVRAPASHRRGGQRELDLGDLYASVEAWSAAHAKTRAQAEQLDRFKSSLGKDASDMLKALSAISDAQLQAARLAVYASLQGDETRGCGAQERRSRLRRCRR